MAHICAIAVLGLPMLTGDADYRALCLALSSSLLVGSDVLGILVMFSRRQGSNFLGSEHPPPSVHCVLLQLVNCAQEAVLDPLKWSQGVRS